MTLQEQIAKAEKALEDLKCINGAMYFGSVEDDSCQCKTRCQNSQTYEHALEELKSFLRSQLTALASVLEAGSVGEEISHHLMQDGVSNDFGHIEGWNAHRTSVLNFYKQFYGESV